jgi:hypothetical protein
MDQELEERIAREKARARRRGELMKLLPKTHEIHDPTKAFGDTELDAFENKVTK